MAIGFYPGQCPHGCAAPCDHCGKCRMLSGTRAAHGDMLIRDIIITRMRHDNRPRACPCRRASDRARSWSRMRGKIHNQLKSSRDSPRPDQRHGCPAIGDQSRSASASFTRVLGGQVRSRAGFMILWLQYSNHKVLYRKVKPAPRVQQHCLRSNPVSVSSHRSADRDHAAATGRPQDMVV
jgi:hypothetical protein